MQSFLQPIARRAHFVFFGKHTLWICSALLFLGLIVWAWANSGGGGARVVFSGKTGAEAEPAAMIKPRYEGTDANNRPYTIVAERALQYDSDTVVLETLTADMMTDAGRWLAVSAVKGTYKLEAKFLTLENDVHLFYDGGYEMRSELAKVAIPQGEVVGDKPVQVQGPDATLEANSFHVLERGAIMRFNGSVKVTLYL